MGYLLAQLTLPPNSPGADPILGKFPKDQKHLEQILDYLPDGIICHNRERRIICFNRAAEALTGYGREEVLGRDWVRRRERRLESGCLSRRREKIPRPPKWPGLSGLRG